MRSSEYMKLDEEQDAITERFVATGKRRHERFDRLVAAVGGDLSKTWKEAEEALRKQEGEA